MSTPNNKDFKKLQKKWYKILKDDGFEDAEVNEETLKRPSNSIFKSARHSVAAGGWQAKADYYHMARHFLNDYSFNRKVDKVIWEYHSEGISYRDIAKLLKNAKVLDVSRTIICRLIQTLRNDMYFLYLPSRGEKKGSYDA